MVEEPLSLNSHIGWHQVLPLLEVDVAVGPFPMIVRCPLCNNRRLHIYDDTKFGGNWHYCPNCKSAGDLVELAASVWKCSVYDTIMRMADNGVAFPPQLLTCAAIAKYEDKYILRRIKHQKLIEAACADLTEGKANVWGIINKLGILQEHHKPTWAKRMGKFVGACDRGRAAAAFHDQAQAVYHGSTRIFVGAGWRDVLVIPFRDLPGRCCGFLFIGRQGNKKDHIYKLIIRHAAYANFAENGLCMYDSLLCKTARQDWFKDDVFVITDPIAAIRLQSKHMRESELPLPIVGTYSAQATTLKTSRTLVTHNTWKNVPNKNFIFWGHKLTADMFDMASRCDGRVWASNDLTRLSKKSAPAWLRYVQRNAKHWSKVLEKILRTWPEAEAYSLLGDLNLQPAVMRQFTENCSLAARERIESFGSQSSSINTIKVKNQRVTESPAGWIVQSTGEAVSDAILRVEKIICRPDAEDSEPYCSGRIICDGAVIEFTERLEVIEKNASKWLRREVLNKLNKLITVKQSWSTSLLDLSKHFYKPLVVREDGQFGWKPHDSRFSLPKFSVTVGAGVNADAAGFIDSWAPGRDLQPPEMPPNAISMLLENNPANQLFWAATACLGANILAPAVGQPQTGIGLRGQGGFLIGKAAARAAGCCEYEFTVQGITKTVDKVLEIDQILRMHNWPLYIQGNEATSRISFSVWINSHQQQNVIQQLDIVQSDTLAMLDTWRFIADKTAVTPSSAIKMYGPLLMPLWLQRLCSQKLQLKSNAELFVHRVLDDFADMLSQYGSTDIIQDAAKSIEDTTDDRAYYFVKLLHDFIDNGVLQFNRAEAGGHPNVTAVYRVDDGDRAPGIFVPRDALNRCLLRKGISMPDPGRITDALRFANALDCECRYNGDVGWFIIERWWEQQIRRCRSDQQRRFKIIGGAR